MKQANNLGRDQQKQDKVLNVAAGHIRALQSLLQQACDEKTRIEEYLIQMQNQQRQHNHNPARALQSREQDLRSLRQSLMHYQHQVGLVEVDPETLKGARRLTEQAYVDHASSEFFCLPRHPNRGRVAVCLFPPRAPDQSGEIFYPANEYCPPQPQRPPPPPPPLPPKA